MRKRTQVWKLSAVVYFYIAHMGAVWLSGSDESDDCEPRVRHSRMRCKRAPGTYFIRARASRVFAFYKPVSPPFSYHYKNIRGKNATTQHYAENQLGAVRFEGASRLRTRARMRSARAPRGPRGTTAGT